MWVGLLIWGCRRSPFGKLRFTSEFRFHLFYLVDILTSPSYMNTDNKQRFGLENVSLQSERLL